MINFDFFMLLVDYIYCVGRIGCVMIEMILIGVLVVISLFIYNWDVRMVKIIEVR